MSVTRVLGTAIESPPDRDCRPISLGAFLRTENHKLLERVSELQRDTAALRSALQNARALRSN